MKLKQLLTAIKYRAEQVPDVDITDLVYDSRKAVPGCAFVCLRGANADGHKYAKMAAEKGARHHRRGARGSARAGHFNG